MSWSSRTPPQRFYAEAAIRAEADAWTVILDGKPLRTPSRQPFLAPRAVAEAAAAEWAAQGARIDPTTMPVTRAVNTAIERIGPDREAVIDEIAAYGGSDLLCHRAGAPAALAEREAAAWNPLLAWAAETLDAPLSVGIGVTPMAQPARSLAALRRHIAAECDIGLAALHDLVSLSGSLVLALAARRGRLEPAAAWAASRVDEAWNVEHWGEDAEAAATAERRRADFEAAARLMRLLPD